MQSSWVDWVDFAWLLLGLCYPDSMWSTINMSRCFKLFNRGHLQNLGPRHRGRIQTSLEDWSPEQCGAGRSVQLIALAQGQSSVGRCVQTLLFSSTSAYCSYGLSNELGTPVQKGSHWQVRRMLIPLLSKSILGIANGQTQSRSTARGTKKSSSLCSVQAIGQGGGGTWKEPACSTCHSQH